MNPLTQIRNTQKISKQEIAAGYSDAQSWHARFKHSAYIYAGGLPFGLTEGDLLAVFSQYGEIIDVNLVRSKESGKSRGFAFLAYEDQRSTNLAVDNLNGTKVGGRIVTVDHVDNYKRKIAEVEGREVSDSDGEPAAVPAEDAEAAAIAQAVSEGAQVVSGFDARTAPLAPGAGVASGGGSDEPWASKSSVYALLNADLPAPKPTRPAAEEEEDPLLTMGKHQKARKEKRKKDKKSKKAKKSKKDQSSPSGSSDDNGDAGLPPPPAAKRPRHDGGNRHERDAEGRPRGGRDGRVEAATAGRSGGGREQGRQPFAPGDRRPERAHEDSRRASPDGRRRDAQSIDRNRSARDRNADYGRESSKRDRDGREYDRREYDRRRRH